MKTKILVVVDCQNDFITGSLKNEAAQKKVSNIVEKINNFNGNCIYVTLDTHYDDYLSTKEGQSLPVPHCIFETDGWKIEGSISDALKSAEVDRNIDVQYITKDTFGSFDLVDSILSLSEDVYGYTIDLDIELVGFCTDICVVSNALLIKAATYDIADITVDASCCASVYLSEEDEAMRQKAALQTMKACQINVINE